MSISSSPVQQGAADQAAGAIAITLAGAPTNGNVLIFVMTMNTNTNSVATMAQTNVTWHRALTTSTNETIEIWYGEVGASASATLTCTLTNGNSTCRGNLSEWSGIATTSEADAAQGSNGTSATPTTASITPTAGRNVLLIASTRKAGTFTAGSETNGFTALTTTNSGWRYSYLVVASTSGSYSTGWAFSTSTAYEAAIASFLAPAASGVTIYPANLPLMGCG